MIYNCGQSLNSGAHYARFIVLVGKRKQFAHGLWVIDTGAWGQKANINFTLKPSLFYIFKKLFEKNRTRNKKVIVKMPFYSDLLYYWLYLQQVFFVFFAVRVFLQ